ncbi:MAG: hypothetical protein LBD90_09765 [Bifidobacteriaceae bacterium]|jgi:hypothetical protein|nr:hypothetical protein [Bifidobacteriaceae bacterium]
MDGTSFFAAALDFFRGMASPMPLLLLLCLAPLVCLTNRAIDGRLSIGLRDPLAKRQLHLALRRRREAAESVARGAQEP